MTHLWDRSITYQEAHYNSYLIRCAKQCSYGITVQAPFQLVLGVHWQLHSKRPGTRWKSVSHKGHFQKVIIFSKHASSNSQVVSSNSQVVSSNTWFVICSKMGFSKLPLLYEQHPLLYEQHPLSSTPTITFFSNIFERFCSKMFEICSSKFEKKIEHLENQFEHHPFEPVRPCMAHNPLDHWQVAQWHHLDRCCVTGGVHQPCWPASTTWTRNAFWQLNRSSRMTQTNLRSWSRPVFDDYFKGYHVYIYI